MHATSHLFFLFSFHRSINNFTHAANANDIPICSLLYSIDIYVRVNETNTLALTASP